MAVILLVMGFHQSSLIPVHCFLKLASFYRADNNSLRPIIIITIYMLYFVPDTWRQFSHRMQIVLKENRLIYNSQH